MLRQIKTQEQIDKKKRKDQIYIGGILIILMTVSTLGYSIINRAGDKNSSTRTELGINFVRENGLWKMTKNGRVFAFQNLPSEVENVSINGSFNLAAYSNKPIYFIGTSQGMPEILNNMAGYVLRYQQACVPNIACSGNYPIKNCSSNLIIFKNGDGTKVSQDNNCVYISGNSVKGADAFLYKILGVN